LKCEPLSVAEGAVAVLRWVGMPLFLSLRLSISLYLCFCLSLSLSLSSPLSLSFLLCLTLFLFLFYRMLMAGQPSMRPCLSVGAVGAAFFDWLLGDLSLSLSTLCLYLFPALSVSLSVSLSLCLCLYPGLYISFFLLSRPFSLLSPSFFSRGLDGRP
jgi:hypothetical protein